MANQDLEKSKDLMSISQVCHFFNIHPNTLRNWDRSGKLKAIRLGSRKDRRYRKEDLIRFFYGEKATSNPTEEDNNINNFYPLEQENLKAPGSSLPILNKK